MDAGEAELGGVLHTSLLLMLRDRCFFGFLILLAASFSACSKDITITSLSLSSLDPCTSQLELRALRKTVPELEASCTTARGETAGYARQVSVLAFQNCAIRSRTFVLRRWLRHACLCP